MPKINLLPKEVAELIAAGEVVERPASVIKELVENSIDAGATDITVEITKGGISYIRITDNGCGIDFADVPTAFLRHATSKISTGNDLENIGTLGFRGEALAAISSVSRVELFTKPKENELGTHYIIEGGEQKLYEEMGCPDGTTIMIRDIFYNTPARMKFLKKDVSEANAAANVVDRIALSHTEVAFKLIRDGKCTLNTSGDKNTKNAVYSVMGREFANSLINAEGVMDRIKVNGLICKPTLCKPTRNYQLVFLNGRLVRSGTVSAAVEQAYKNSAMVGKFPAFVLYLTIPFDTVDVNVHPAKTEVRFSDEKRIFDAVYHTVKTSLLKGDSRPEVSFKAPVFNQFKRKTTEQYRQEVIKPTVAEQIYSEPIKESRPKSSFTFKSPQVKPSFMNSYSVVGKNGEEVKPTSPPIPVIKEEVKISPKSTVNVDIAREETEEKPPIRAIGEAFSTYIIAEMGDSVYMLDKHAAHERILYNELKSSTEIAVQQLLTPVTVVLNKDEYIALLNEKEKLNKAGFEIEDFGNSAIRVLSLPSALKKENIESLILELAENIIKTSLPEVERLDDIFHTVACRAAIKAGNRTTPLEMQQLAERVLSNDDIMYCPHGRPVAFRIKRRELEKQFGRIQ